MTYSEVKIKFNEDIALDSLIIMTINVSGSTLGIILYEKWVTLRSLSNQVTTGIPSILAGERAAINFMQAFNLDYNSTNLYVTQRIDNEVTIKATDPNVTFSNGSATIHGILGSQPTVLNVDFNYTNFNGSIFSFTDINFEESTTPCLKVKVKVTTSEVANIIGYSIGSSSTTTNISNTNTDNPFYFEILRGLQFTVKCSNGTNTISATLKAPQRLDSNPTININNSPNGATVIISLLNIVGLNLQYSLDNTTWQTSNIFNGLAADNYTVFVKDQYGCSISKSFIVDEFGVNSPFFFISKSNSIRFAKRVDWGDCSNYKNYENTLSCEADVPLPKLEVQKFQSCDIITTQFKSNYNDISASVIKSNGDEISLNIDRKTNNIGLKDRRDAIKYNLGNGKTGIYFVSGNIYNYNTGVDTGIDYILNGSLPVWGVEGNYIKLINSWFLINDIIYDENRNSEVIVIESVYTGNDISVQVSCSYNLFNYDVYEFRIDMSNYLDQNIRIRINNNDNSFENLTHLSELINVKVKQENTVEIRYKNDTNTDVFYATGIEHKIRIPINKINGKVEENSETYKTDTTALLLSAEVYELDEFIFEPVTKQLMRKLIQALSHNILKMDGVSYVKNDSPEVEGALEDTNLYIVKVTMVKAGSVYNSQNGDGGNMFSSGSTEIPGLIDSGDGFVIY